MKIETEEQGHSVNGTATRGSIEKALDLSKMREQEVQYIVYESEDKRQREGTYCEDLMKRVSSAKTFELSIKKEKRVEMCASCL